MLHNSQHNIHQLHVMGTSFLAYIGCCVLSLRLLFPFLSRPYILEAKMKRLDCRPSREMRPHLLASLLPSWQLSTTTRTYIFKMETLRLVSFNCRGLPCANSSLYKRPSVQLLLDDTNNDIICLQETWFTKQDLQHLNDVHPDFHGTGVSTVDSRDGPIYGHPPPPRWSVYYVAR